VGELIVEEKDRNLDAISKLISLTREGAIDWKSESPDTVNKYSGTDKVNSVFSAEYLNKSVRIFKHMYEADNPYVGLSSMFYGKTKNELPKKVWRSEVILELYDKNSLSTLWQFPKETINNDLLKTIKFKIAGAADFIDGLLSE
jgi:hypothetical protein